MMRRGLRPAPIRTPMRQTSRRAFIKRSSAAALAAAAKRGSSAQPQAEPATEASAGIPPHRPLHLPGIHAYPDSQSVAAGEKIRFHVSGTEGYRNSHPEAPAWSCYLNHHAGQPGCQFGLRMPWPSAGPYLLYSEGGAAVVLSGNTMCWRTSFNADGTVMECRKHGESIGGRSGARIGELYHSHDGRRGGLMRECGYPAWKNIGLECVGWAGTTPDQFGIYQTVAPDHFLFNEPEKTGLT